MKITEDQVIDYLTKLGASAVSTLMLKIREIDDEISIRKYESSKKSYKKNKLKNIIAGEKFKKTVKVGMLLKMRGTRDREGLREVLEINDDGLVCRKIICHLFHKTTSCEKTYKRDTYITSHQWDKIIKILHEDFSIGLAFDNFIKNR